MTQANVVAVSKVEAFMASKMGKIVLMVLAFAVIAGVSAYAGSTDNLGIKTTYDSVVGWFTDTYVSRTVAIILFVIGVTRAIQGQWLQFFIMLGFAVLISQGQTIIEKLFSATLPM
jgi:hypothetical protein